MIKQFLCFAALAMTCATVTAAQLTSEDDLKSPATVTDIESFWEANFKVQRFTGARGVEIAHAAFLQPDREKEKGALVIVSGRTESMLKYKELVRDLTNNGWSVYIHDHRGQGLSDREPEVQKTPQRGHVHNFDDFVSDLRQHVVTKVLPNGHKRHVLLAHSMGGAIAALFLEQGGDAVSRFDAAVLSSPMLKIKGMVPYAPAYLSCPYSKRRAKKIPAEYVDFGKDYDPKPFDKNEYTNSAVRYDRLLMQYRAETKIQLGSPTYRWMDEACEAAYRARKQAAKVMTPVRVLVAGEDSIVHNSGAEEFCKALPSKLGGCGGKDRGPVTVEGAKHELFIERDELRKRAIEEALAFLEKKS